jgi:hypothetical protein
VEVTYSTKLHFVINVRIKSDFITNSVKYGVLRSWLQHYRIREKFDLSIINYRQVKACCMPEPVASTSRDRIFLTVVVICPPA